MKIGFIGLGKMGAPMAHNLLKAGNDLTVYDVMPEAVAALCADGAKAATSIPEVSAGMDVVITMVQTGKQVSDVCLGDAGIFRYIPSSALYLDCSSIDIVTTKSLHEEAKNRLAQIFDKEEFKSFGGIVYDKKIPVLQNFQETIEEMEEEIENHTGYLESTYVNPARKELYKENLKTLKKIIALLRSEKAGIKNSLFNKLLGGLGISKGGKLTYAETLVYVYLHSKISGIKKLEKYEYCVVDEGQDLSAMEYLFLNELVLYGRMCVFGDLNQGFAENGVQDWGTVVEVVDGAKNASKFELDTNYRSTKQIIDFATDILAPYTKTYLPKSINRMGEQPRIIGSVSLPAVLSKEVVIENGRPKKSVGIICFNRDLIELARVAIESIGISKDSLVLLDAKKRITYLPNGVYLTHFDDCKGLEFNKVIVLGFDLGQVKTFADAKKAFVAVTRAMNELVVIS